LSLGIVDKEVSLQAEGSEAGATDAFDAADVGQGDGDVFGEASAVDDEASVGGEGVGGVDSPLDDEEHQGKSHEGHDALPVPIGPNGDNGEQNEQNGRVPRHTGMKYSVHR